MVCEICGNDLREGKGAILSLTSGVFHKSCMDAFRVELEQHLDMLEALDSEQLEKSAVLADLSDCPF